MSRFKVKVFGDPGEDICELEEIKYLLHLVDRIIVVDGRAVNTYAEFVQVVSQEKYKDQEFIEVVQVPRIEGG